MTSKMYSLTQSDFIKSLSSSVFIALVAAVYGLTSQGNFDIFTADWNAILKLVLNSAIITFVGRMAEKFLTDSNGKVLGKIG